VVGFKLKGQLKEGVTATDLVLTVTQMLRKQGVVGKFVEFFGPGLDFPLGCGQATIATWRRNMAPTCGFFPVDAETIDYLQTSGRKADRVALVVAYAKAQAVPHANRRSGVHGKADARLARRVPSMAGPKRPEGRSRCPRWQKVLPPP